MAVAVNRLRTAPQDLGELLDRLARSLAGSPSEGELQGARQQASMLVPSARNARRSKRFMHEVREAALCVLIPVCTLIKEPSSKAESEELLGMAQEAVGRLRRRMEDPN